MKWYTLTNGRLCLGTDQQKFANFHTATDIVLKKGVNTPLLPEHIDLIGTLPEDWCDDEKIEQKINQTAKHLFGLSHLSEQPFFA